MLLKRILRQFTQLWIFISYKYQQLCQQYLFKVSVYIFQYLFKLFKLTIYKSLLLQPIYTYFNTSNTIYLSSCSFIFFFFFPNRCFHTCHHLKWIAYITTKHININININNIITPKNILNRSSNSIHTYKSMH